MRPTLQHRHLAEHRAHLRDPRHHPVPLDHLDDAVDQEQQPPGPAALGQHDVTGLESQHREAGESLEHRLQLHDRHGRTFPPSRELPLRILLDSYTAKTRL